MENTTGAGLDLALPLPLPPSPLPLPPGAAVEDVDTAMTTSERKAPTAASPRRKKEGQEASEVRRSSLTLDHFTGDSLLHFSYHPAQSTAAQGLPDPHLAGSFVTAFAQGLDTSLNVPFMAQTLSPTLSPLGENSYIFPSVARNPNKAIVTIDSRTSRILVANEMTCELFAYQRDELVGMKVQQLFTEPYRARHRVLVEQNIDQSGETVLISGKVVRSSRSSFFLSLHILLPPSPFI